MREEPPHNEDAHRTSMRIRERELQAARDGAKDAESKLYDELWKDHVYDVTMRIAALIDAKVELALLERGGG